MSYQRKGRFIEVNIIVTITTNGTGAGFVGLTLPFSVINSVISGREVNISGAQVTGFATGSQIQIRKYDNSYPGANGAVIVLSGVIQLA